MSEDTVILRGLLITREAAKQFRNRLVNLLERYDTVRVDLSAVELITPSFADECFGILGERYGRDAFRTRLRLLGLSNEVKHLISVVLANRLKGRSKAPERNS